MLRPMLHPMLRPMPLPVRPPQPGHRPSMHPGHTPPRDHSGITQPASLEAPVGKPASRLNTHFNGYAGFLGDSLMRDIQNSILHVVKRRCEQRSQAGRTP